MEYTGSRTPDELLRADDFAGRVMRLAALAEARLDILLSHYFCGYSEHSEFFDLITDRLTFSAKIEILNKLTFHKPLSSQSSLVKMLRGLSFLRNKLAHQYHLADHELAPIVNHPATAEFLHDDVKRRGRQKIQLESRFHQLWQSIDRKCGVVLKKRTSDPSLKRTRRKRRAA